MAKKKKNLIPKEIAGFKVPKAIRKSSALKALLASDTGRGILASALTAGAGAAASVLMGEREDIAAVGKKGARKTAGAFGIASEALESAASAAMAVVKDSATSMLPKDVRKKSNESGREEKEERPFASAVRH
jgi:hypothetical protein